MITPRQRERESYDEYSDHRVDHSVREHDFYDKRKERKPTKHGDKFIPLRRGSAKITWPLAPKKALILLTGRKTFRRALVAFDHFLNARRAHWKTPLDNIRKIALEEPWPEDFFGTSAEEYLKYPRKGFNRAKQEERISKLLRKLGPK
jgi:hypothetical protein